MSSSTFVMLLLGLVVAVYVLLAVRAYIRLRGDRVVVCPETNKPSAVGVDALHAALSAVWELPEIRLRRCSRWPQRERCRQACVGQIAVDPEGTSATEMLKKWYAGKSCGVCRRAIPRVTGSEPRPGLLNVASRTHEILSWEDVPPEQLPAVFASHLPVCPSCHVAAAFRRQFPDMVTERAATDKRDLVVH
jgi:hypothetical protein